MAPLLLPIAVAIGLSATVAAQAPSPDDAGYGSRYVEVDLSARTGNPLHLGAAVDLGTGHIFVSATGPLGVPPHLVHEFDARGVYLAAFPQPRLHDTSPFGVRDMAHDGSSLIGGSEVGVTVFSTTGQLVNQIQAALGPMPITQPIQGAALAQLGVIRAVAFDPRGDAGRGSLFVADFASPILEVDLTGAVLATIPNGGWSIYGLAYAAARDTLWVNASATGELVEIARATGVATGRTLAGSGDAGAGPGGLSIASGVAGHHEPWDSELLLVEVAQGPPGPDRLAIRRVDLFAGVNGDAEPVLRGGLQGSPLLRQVVRFTPADVLEFVVDPNGASAAGLPCWTIVNFFLDAERDAYTDLSPYLPGAGVLPEFRSLFGISVPSTTVYVQSPHAIGTVIPIAVPPTLPLNDGDLLRLQSLYLLPASPTVFAATNELNLLVDLGERGIVVSAHGANSFQADPSTPFWTITSDLTHGHGDIIAVELSFAGAVGPAALQRFDLDQTSMSDRFDGGNSTAPGCAGTYRSGSDQLCGLDYAASGVYVDPLCHLLPGESAGFAATMVPGFATDAHTISFDFQAFSPGKTFAFDCDTDGGAPSGDAHAGLLVRIETSNSGTLVGELQIDVNQPDRAVLFFP